jgi:CheY-like chemotaxis protein
MKILIIDDEEYRHEWLGSALKDHDVVSARTDKQAFKHTQFDLAFFDHDLACDMDGSQLAYEVLNNPDVYKAPKKAWAHSMNWSGANNIAAKFRSCGIPCDIQDFSSMMMRGKEELVRDIRTWTP